MAPMRDRSLGGHHNPAGIVIHIADEPPPLIARHLDRERLLLVSELRNGFAGGDAGQQKAEENHHRGDRPAGLPEEPAVLREAIREFFSERAVVSRRRLRQLFRRGRTSLAIGVTFLAASLLIGDVVARLLGQLRSVRADLRFRDDGMHTILTIERRKAK